LQFSAKFRALFHHPSRPSRPALTPVHRPMFDGLGPRSLVPLVPWSLPPAPSLACRASVLARTFPSTHERVIPSEAPAAAGGAEKPAIDFRPESAADAQVTLASSSAFPLFPAFLLPAHRSLTTNQYPLTTAFYPPPCPRHPPPPISVPHPHPCLSVSCFSAPCSFVPLVPCSLLFYPPPLVSSTPPPMPFCETVKL